MESLTKEDILLKDSLTYKELMKSLKLFGAIAILAFVGESCCNVFGY